jgi:hypothetical protein
MPLNRIIFAASDMGVLPQRATDVRDPLWLEIVMLGIFALLLC